LLSFSGHHATAKEGSEGDRGFVADNPRGRSPKEENVQILHIFSEEEEDISEDTATEVAQQTGVSRRTILNDVKFKEAWERLQEISPKAAEIVLRDEVRDAKTQLPKVPPEVLPFVAKRIEEGARSIKRILMEWRQEQKEQRLKERAPLGRVGTHAGTGARTGAREF
jgi:hypothetical protein